MECRLGGSVVCCFGAYPTAPSSPPALRSGAGSTMASTNTAQCGPALLCLCQRGWCSTTEVCRVDILRVVFVQVGSGVGCVVLCCVVLCVSFVLGFC